MTTFGEERSPLVPADKPCETVLVPESALRDVLVYLWDDELEDYLDTGRPDSHICLALEKLRAAYALAGLEPPVDPLPKKDGLTR